MKNITIILLLCAFGCSKSPTETATETKEVIDNQDYTSFEWLKGVWERSMSGDSVMNHFETWTSNDNGLFGNGITIVGDVVESEDILIYSSNDSFFYRAHPQQNLLPTNFYISEIRNNFFRCENSSHDYPKYIEYQRTQDSLFAIIGDNKRRTQFKFKLQDERNLR
jgi:hypothetical protein